MEIGRVEGLLVETPDGIGDAKTVGVLTVTEVRNDPHPIGTIVCPSTSPFAKCAN